MNYNGTILENNRTLAYYKIHKCSIIEAEVDFKGPTEYDCTFQVYIDILYKDKTIDVCCDKINSYVSELKLRIYEKTGILPNGISLHYYYKHLQDDKKLSDYDVSPSGLIKGYLRLRGAKPVIYLYPKEEIDAKVSIKINYGDFSFVYPSFDEESTWNVRAHPSGEILHRGKKLRYLFWETIFYPNLNMDKGFIIKGEESVSFFEDSLKSRYAISSPTGVRSSTNTNMSKYPSSLKTSTRCVQ